MTLMKLANQAAPVVGFLFILLFFWLGCEEREEGPGRRRN